MLGYFDAQDGNPKVVIKISGTKRGAKKEIASLLDTGHSGSLSLPILDLIEIGAKLSSFGPVGLADGRSNQLLLLYGQSRSGRSRKRSPSCYDRKS